MVQLERPGAVREREMPMAAARLSRELTLAADDEATTSALLQRSLDAEREIELEHGRCRYATGAVALARSGARRATPSAISSVET